MKVFILTLLVLNSLCFVLGGEEETSDFVDLDADEVKVLESAPEVEDVEDFEDYADDEEEPNFMDDMEKDDDNSEEGEGNDEPEDPNGFKDDDFEPLEDPGKNNAGKDRPQVRPKPPPQPTKPILPTFEEITKPPKPSEGPGSGQDLDDEDADLEQSLGDKLGLK